MTAAVSRPCPSPGYNNGLPARIIEMNTLKRRIKILFTEKADRFYVCRRLRATSLVPALLITVFFISCAARETEGPVTSTEAAAPGTAAEASEVGGAQGKDALDQLPSSTVVASASRDGDAWFLVTNVDAERKYKVYVDTSTIQTIDGEVYSWSKLVFDNDQHDTDGLVYREVMISSAIDCAKNTYSNKSSKFYDSLGRMVYMENIGTNSTEIPDQSVSRHIADFVCGYNPAEAKKAASSTAQPTQKSK